MNQDQKKIIINGLAPLEPDVIYVFGSHAKGENRKESDMDIAYLCAQPIPQIRNFEIARELEAKLRVDVDLISLREASAVLKIQVIKSGLNIFSKNRRVQKEFEMYAFSDYARLNEERKPILDRIQKEGHVYGSGYIPQ